MRRIVIVAVLLALIIVGVAVVSFRLFYPSNSSSTVSSLVSVSSSTTSIAGNFTVTLTDSMPLPNVGERFDHMSIDIENQTGLHRGEREQFGLRCQSGHGGC